MQLAGAGETAILAAAGGGAGVPMRELALIALVAAAATFLLTGVVRYAVVASGWLDEPRSRDVHDIPKPRLGGVAMYTGVIIAVLLASNLPALNRGFPPVTPDMEAVVWSATVLLCIGVADDLFDLDALTKLLGQILAALVLSLKGVSWYLLYVPFDGGSVLVLDPVLATILTVLFTVALINAINFVDGIDGLAAGLGMIAAGAILVYSMVMLHDQGGAVSAYPPAMISAALLGACLGFLPHNFEPARIFMGDSGAMLIGLLLAAASTSASGRISPTMFGTADAVALWSPIIVVAAALSIPMLDLVLAVLRRTRAGKSPFAPDKMHLHHRLLDLGHSHRRVVLVLYTWVSVVAYAAVGTTVFPAGFVLLTFGVLLIVAVLVTFGWRGQIGEPKHIRDESTGHTTPDADMSAAPAGRHSHKARNGRASAAHPPRVKRNSAPHK
ncbi:undecaprenyl/decaprenyl-phosphate alpha-N-acetylglucosaminyl 1-phosphate transferase [Corynebacterium sp. TAE3-ERU12]|uniref:MraY family glycosyltransferase n=1 Tax=Corynebacterium sp. TAE3-ERU12 TaxID=2849491 RepID=UPI001C439900|nr:undecaprenyl/decaprenyl-phosphate alpha-N-acetylglucosaminyl 1-phosphate transferase [Corynebacterium sp. TAE3-ERU12]